jgi:membrane protease YdiL (CAAX protease family)
VFVKPVRPGHRHGLYSTSAARPRDWPLRHAAVAGGAAVFAAVPAVAAFRADSPAQNFAGFLAMALAVVTAAILTQRGLRAGVSLLSATGPRVSWACWIGGALVLMTLSSAAWVHIFHPAARDVALNLVAEQVRAPHSGHASTSAVMLALWVTVAGPAAEELLDRGLLFNVAAQARRWVSSRYSPAVVLLAAILSSLFFALSHTGVHGDAANTIPDRFAMGMILCGVCTGRPARCCQRSPSISPGTSTGFKSPRSAPTRSY